MNQNSQNTSHFPDSVVVLGSPSANLNSIYIALRRIQHELGATGKSFSLSISSKPEEILAAERLIFPGVGHAGYIAAQLQKSGLDRALCEAAAARIPIMGICLGMQLLFSELSEGGGVRGLGLLSGSILPLRKALDNRPENCTDRASRIAVPHMGWNRITALHNSRIIRNVCNGKDQARSYDILLPGHSAATCYFVHSYYLPPCAETVATCHYGGVEISAMVRGTGQNRHIWGCQFHPEKSAHLGSQILRNWLQYADAV